MRKLTLTNQLTELIANKPITHTDLKHAALLTLDAIANALAGRSTKPGAILLRLIGQNFAEVDASRWAFLWGALTHILEIDDVHRSSVTHPGCIVVPAAWSVAVRGGMRGHAMLKAVLWGFEAMTRVGMAVGPSHYRMWHNTATCGPYGSAMAAASLLCLDQVATVHALGNAGTQSAGLWQFLEDGTLMTKHLHAGRAAEAGILAADLASFGFTGPQAILEGAKGWFAATCPDADPSAVTRDPNGNWQLLMTSIKPWPSCRHTHSVIDASIGLQHRIKLSSIIERVEVKTYPTALEICDLPEPSSDYEAKFSLQHCVAAALTLSKIDCSAFSEAARAELAEFRKKVTLKAAEPYSSAYPISWGGAVTVTTYEGKKLTERRDNARGDPGATAMSQVELISKARVLMAYGGVPEPDLLIDAVLALSDDMALPSLTFKKLDAVVSAQK